MLLVWLHIPKSIWKHQITHTLFLAEAGLGGRRVNRMYYGEFENDQVFEECLFFYFQGGTGLYTRGYVCKIL